MSSLPVVHPSLVDHLRKRFVRAPQYQGDPHKAAASWNYDAGVAEVIDYLTTLYPEDLKRMEDNQKEQTNELLRSESPDESADPRRPSSRSRS